MPGIDIEAKLKPVLDDTTLRSQMQNSPIVDSVGGGETLNYENMQSLAEATVNSTDSLKNNAAIMKEFGDVMPEIIKNLRYMNSVVAQTTTSLPAIKKQVTSEELKKQKKNDLIDQGFLGVVNSGSNLVQSYANGNFGGVVGGVISGTTGSINNLSKLAENAEMSNLAKDLAKMGIVTAVAGTVVKGADILANKYIDEMPTIFNTGRAFGDMSNAGAIGAYNRINEFNRGTNLSVDEFQGIAQSLRTQLVGNGLGSDEQLSLVGGIAQRSGQLAYAMGGDASQYAQLAALMSRYGGSTNVVDDMDRVVASGIASGLEKGQLSEFLSSIQKIMEDGIAKGFSRSATEVASTMLMFSKMSGNNAFWQGEQGAKIINQANAGLASATSLSKTSDIIAYRAIARAFSGTTLDENGNEISKEKAALGDLYLEDGDYVNKMMLLEKGLTPETFNPLMESINETESSTMGRIERIRQMFGLNYTGATRVMDLKREDYSSDEEFKEALEKIQNDPKMQNNETRNQQALNEIKAAVVNVGEGLANVKISGMEGISSAVSNIEKWLGLDYKARADEQEANDIMDSLSDEKFSIVSSNMKYFGDKKYGLERLKALQDWNGFGRIPGITDDQIFNNDPISPDIKKGETWADVVGAWSLDTGIGKNNKNNKMFDFLKLGFGEEILKKFGGNKANADLFIKTLAESKQADEFRAKVQDWSDDKVYSKSEQEKTLKLIYELLNKGITLNESR